MVTPLIAADQLAKAYGGHHLFDDATFQVDPGDKVALVGPNGAGKSTLLRILAGRERPDHGTLQLQPVPTQWFEQHPHVPPGATVRDLLAADRPVPPALAEEKRTLEARIADPALYETDGYNDVLERYAQIEREVAQAAAAPPPNPEMLRDLGFADAALDAPAGKLSGGQKTRLFLARALGNARPGGLVVLDEPTNHLDIESIEWLEDWLDGYDGTLLVVAHDRAFLDNVATRVFEVAQGRIRTYRGTYEDYVQQRDEDLERVRRDRERAEKRVQDAQGVLQQFRHQKRFDGQYASRMKVLEKYQAALQRAPDPVLEKLGFGLRFQAAHKASDEMVQAAGLAKSLGGVPVLRGVDLEITKGDRVGLVGANGTGKTTLLRIITRELAPDAGTLRVPPGVRVRYMGQEHDDLDPDRSLLEEVLASRPGLEERDVKAVIGRFRFDPDADLRRTVASLSGGERQRLMLLKCVLEPSNLLILDEPTNHLDLWARDVVVQALNSYHGTLLLVSHDRFILDAVTTTTAVLDEHGLHTYPGSFTQTRDLHRRRVGAATTRRYVVRKKFTDWNTNTRYHVNAEPEFTDADLEANRILRNAVANGWLEPAEP